MQKNKKRYDLQKFIDIHSLDIILISETKLKKCHEPRIKNYTIIRTDRIEKGGGGTAIIISNTIKFTTIAKPSSRNNKTLEYTAVKLPTKNNKSLYIFSIYAPTTNSSTFIQELEKLFQDFNLENYDNSYIIAGDFNAKSTTWGDPTSNLRGEQLRLWEEERSLTHRVTLYTPVSPTFPAANSFLDHCIADTKIDMINLVNNDKLKTLAYDSDHRAIYFEAKINQISDRLPIPPM